MNELTRFSYIISYMLYVYLSSRMQKYFKIFTQKSNWNEIFRVFTSGRKQDRFLTRIPTETLDVIFLVFDIFEFQMVHRKKTCIIFYETPEGWKSSSFGRELAENLALGAITINSVYIAESMVLHTQWWSSVHIILYRVTDLNGVFFKSKIRIDVRVLVICKLDTKMNVCNCEPTIEIISHIKDIYI